MKLIAKIFFYRNKYLIDWKLGLISIFIMLMTSGDNEQ